MLTQHEKHVAHFHVRRFVYGTLRRLTRNDCLPRNADASRTGKKIALACVQLHHSALRLLLFLCKAADELAILYWEVRTAQRSQSWNEVGDFPFPFLQVALLFCVFEERQKVHAVEVLRVRVFLVLHC